MKVYLIGVGMGDPGTMTLEAKAAVEESALLIGAPRLLEPWQESHSCVPHIGAEEIAQRIQEQAEGPVAVLLSGDVGFYSGAKGLWPLLEGHEVVTLPGISSLSYFCAKLRTPWQDAKVVSAHGRSHNAVGEIQRSPKTFVLTGGSTRAQDLCAQLTRRGLGDIRVSVGERLSYPDERIVTATAQALAGETFADLAVLLAENPHPIIRRRATAGLEDDAFLRGDVPMTKEEVRTLVVSKLRLEEDHTVWDVGAGTGSVSVECALACPAGQVVAIERKPEAVALLGENKARFGLTNLEVAEGQAPDILEALPAPDRVFLGGTGGNLRAILDAVFAKNPAARVVCTAVTLETVAEAARAFADLPRHEMVQLSVTRTRRAGGYHLMDPQSPIWLFSGEGQP